MKIPIRIVSFIGKLFTLLLPVVSGCGGPQLAGAPPPPLIKFTSPSRPEQKAGTPSADQRRAIEAFAVKLDVEDPAALPVGFGLGATDYPEPTRSTLIRIEMLSGAQFDWQFSRMLPDGAMAFPGGIIVINDQRMASLTPDGRFLGLLHEAAHHLLGHTSNAGLVTVMNQPWLMPTLEMQADAWAVGRLCASGMNKNRILMSAMEVWGASPGDQNHPPGSARIDYMRQVLNGCV